MTGYIEYRSDSFGLKKHLPESVKNVYIHRIKASSRIGKKLYIEYFSLFILIRENIFSQVFDKYCHQHCVNRPSCNLNMFLQHCLSTWDANLRWKYQSLSQVENNMWFAMF